MKASTGTQNFGVRYMGPAEEDITKELSRELSGVPWDGSEVGLPLSGASKIKFCERFPLPTDKMEDKTPPLAGDEHWQFSPKMAFSKLAEFETQNVLGNAAI